MATWPSNLPVPLKTISIQSGSKMIVNTMLSGRRVVRNWGAVPPDKIKVQLRLQKTQLYSFHFFWNRTGMSGIYFFASWLTSLGYDNHMARFLGYPKCKGVTTNIIDFSVTMLVKNTNDVILFSDWPTG